MFAIGTYASPPSAKTVEQAAARRAGGVFTLTEAREERTKARALVKQGINPAHSRQLDRIKREQANATTFEAVANEWLALKDWEDMGMPALSIRLHALASQRLRDKAERTPVVALGDMIGLQHHDHDRPNRRI